LALGRAIGQRALVAREVVLDARLGQLPPLALLALEKLLLMPLLVLRVPFLKKERSSTSSIYILHRLYIYMYRHIYI